MNATKCSPRVARMYTYLVWGGGGGGVFAWLHGLDLQMCMYVYTQTYTSPHKVFTLPIPQKLLSIIW